MLKYSSSSKKKYIFGCLGNILTIVVLSRIRCQESQGEKSYFLQHFEFSWGFCVTQSRVEKAFWVEKKEKKCIPFKFIIEKSTKELLLHFHSIAAHECGFNVTPVFCPRTLNLTSPKSLPSL